MHIGWSKEGHSLKEERREEGDRKWSKKEVKICAKRKKRNFENEKNEDQCEIGG